MLEKLLYWLVAYLIGSIPTGYLIVKKLKGIDIREHGSGNTGATNVKRVAGNNVARLVLFIDFLKGCVPVMLYAGVFFPGDYSFQLAVALATMIGHSRSIFLKFSGGKAAVTGLGCLFAMEPLATLFIALVALGIFKFTRFVSLGSITAAASGPIFFYLFHAPLPHLLFSIVGGGLVIVLHRSNIQRLLQGTENRL